ncbi:hypothetical protein JG688_00017841, partial [Phytophthora aleatoria]
LRPRAVVTALADSLANNKVLAHLDLSSNRLDLEDCTLLAKQLENNQTRIGLHMSGNCAVMDSRGFLIPKAQAHHEEGYTEFLSEAKILDESSEYCSLPDLENVFVAANLELTQEAKEKDNPDRSLTRFEFLECIIRIATNKYFRTNVCDTPAKAVDKLLQENIQPVASEDANEFRSRFLYTEEVSDAFTDHITLLQELYDANMGKYCKPGEKKGMHLVEFLVLLEKYQVFCDSFRVRDVKDPFLACKLMVLDEMTT